MNGQREDNPSSCYFHPDVAFVGVCPLCLNERLVVLAAKQSYHRLWISSHAHKAHRHHQSRIARSTNAGINIPKIFAIGSLLNRLEFRYRRNDSPNAASFSPEDDSFISIKFADNGVASWEKNPESKFSHDNWNIPWIHGDSIGKAATFKDQKGAATTTTKSVIEHSKPRVASLRWKKRIGHLFHLVRWKSSSNAGCLPPGQQGGRCEEEDSLDEDSDKQKSQRMKMRHLPFAALPSSTNLLLLGCRAICENL